MLCDRCKKNEAQIYFEQIINGKKKEINLCFECSQDIHMSFNNIFHNFLFNTNYNNENHELNILKCSRCGLKYNDFIEIGKLGCGNCYKDFSKELDLIFKNIQANKEHRGKIPHKAGSDLLHKREVQNLKNQLQIAIEKEEYEEAAALRDKIRFIEQNGSKGV